MALLTTTQTHAICSWQLAHCFLRLTATTLPGPLPMHVLGFVLTSYTAPTPYSGNLPKPVSLSPPSSFIFLTGPGLSATRPRSGAGALSTALSVRSSWHIANLGPGTCHYMRLVPFSRSTPGTLPIQGPAPATSSPCFPTVFSWYPAQPPPPHRPVRLSSFPALAQSRYSHVPLLTSPIASSTFHPLDRPPTFAFSPVHHFCIRPARGPPPPACIHPPIASHPRSLCLYVSPSWHTANLGPGTCHILHPFISHGLLLAHCPHGPPPPSYPLSLHSPSRALPISPLLQSPIAFSSPLDQPPICTSPVWELIVLIHTLQSPCPHPP